eukprot:tig00000670_g3049.t1
MASVQLFCISIPGNVLELDGVVLNDHHVLRRINLYSLCDEDCVVKLRSDFGDRVIFQLHNENLHDGEDALGGVRSSASMRRSQSDDGLAARAREDDASSTESEEFNELFNLVDVVTEVHVPARGSASFVFNFRADRTLGDPRDPAALLVGAAGAGAAQLEDREGGEAAQALALRRTYATRRMAGRLFLDGSAAHGAQQQSVLEVRVEGCRSVLRAEPAELVFDECVPGSTYVKDLTVLNASELPTRFILRPPPRGPFEFTDYSSGLPMSRGPVELKGYDRVSIRVTFRPRAVGSLHLPLDIENVRDEANTINMTIVAYVAPPQVRSDGLLVTFPGGGALDFGDCYAGLPSRQVLTVTNVTRETLEIHVAVERDRGEQPAAQRGTLIFDTHTDAEQARPRATPPARAPLARFPPLTGVGRGRTRRRRPRTRSTRTPTMTQTGTRPAPAGTSPGPSGRASAPAPTTPPAPAPAPRPARAATRRAARSRRAATRATGRRGRGGGRAGPDSPGPPGGAREEAEEGGLGGEESEAEERRPRRRGGKAAKGQGRERERGEELTLAPGQQRRVVVWYYPPTEADLPELKSGRPAKVALRVSLRGWAAAPGAAGRHHRSLSQVEPVTSKAVQVKASVTASLVRVFPALLNFGDCNIGSRKTAKLQVQNLSDLPTSIAVRYDSKVVSVTPLELAIGPRQLGELDVAFCPLRVNPNYRKQIKVVNQRNRREHHIVEVAANNMDAHRVTFHSLFYKLITPTASNAIVFGDSVVNFPAMRSVRVKNITAGPLALKFEPSDPGELSVYREGAQRPAFALSHAASSALAPAASAASLASLAGGLLSGSSSAGGPLSALLESITENPERRFSLRGGRPAAPASLVLPPTNAPAASPAGGAAGSPASGTSAAPSTPRGPRKRSASPSWRKTASVSDMSRLLAAPRPSSPAAAAAPSPYWGPGDPAGLGLAPRGALPSAPSVASVSTEAQREGPALVRGRTSALGLLEALRQMEEAARAPILPDSDEER